MQTDPSDAVQVRAATALAMMHAGLPAEDPVRNQALAEVVANFVSMATAANGPTANGVGGYSEILCSNSDRPAKKP